MKYNLSQALPFFEEAAKQADKIFFGYDISNQKFLFLNPAFELIFNKPVESISKPIELLDCVHAEDKEYVSRIYAELVNGARKKEIVFRILVSAEEQRWMEVNPYYINKNGKQVIVGYVEDVSEKKNKEDVMQEYASKKNSILEILSHDLAGPLTKIKGAAALMAEELQQHKHPTLERMVGMIEETSERSIRLIREFVKQEFLHSKNSALVKERVNLVEKMRELLAQYEESEDKISKSFKFNVNREKIYIDIDAYKFSQVINNLISNAIKFTADGGQIALFIEDREDTVLVSVADDGIGIPDQYHDNLFERFTDARRPGIKGEPSVGLGMSIIKTIVEWHKGKIWFKSKEGEGTTFFIELPKE